MLCFVISFSREHTFQFFACYLNFVYSLEKITIQKKLKLIPYNLYRIYQHTARTETMTSSYPSLLITSDFTGEVDINTVKNYLEYFGIASIDTKNAVSSDENTMEIPIVKWFDNEHTRNMVDSINENGFDTLYYTPEKHFNVAFDYGKNPLNVLADLSDEIEYRDDVVKHDNVDFNETLSAGSSDDVFNSLVSTISNMKITLDEQVSEMGKMKDYIAEAHHHILYLNKKNTELTRSVSLLKRAITNSHIQKRAIAKSTWNRRLRVLK